MLDESLSDRGKAVPNFAKVTANLGSLSAQTTTASKKPTATKVKANKKKGKVAEDDDKSSFGGIGGLQGTEASAFLLQLQKDDPEMAAVCAKHESIRGTTAQCLAKLDVGSFLRGLKWGQALTGAWCL